MAATDHRQLALKYKANRNMRRACCPKPCFAGPAGCCVGLVGSLLRGSGLLMSFMEVGRCRCLSCSVVMVEFIGYYIAEVNRLAID